MSKSTVSAVMNDSRPVSDRTREKVQDAVRELNYRPRATARNRQPAGRSIGVVVKERSNPFFAEVAEGVSKRAAEAGYTVYTASSEGDYATETDIIKDLRQRDTDGLIIYPVINGQTDLSNLIELRQARVPFVLMEHIMGVKAHTVDVSILSAAKIAVKHLIDGGHRRIVHFSGPSYSRHSDERIDGMRHAFSESELAFSNEMVIPAGARIEDGYRAGIEYFKSVSDEKRPTAVTCFNDLVALGVLRALRECDLSVPEDVSLVGCDGIDLVDYLSVPLTTIRSPIREMGARAASILIDHIEAGERPEPQTVRFEPEFVVRESTRTLHTS